MVWLSTVKILSVDCFIKQSWKFLFFFFWFKSSCCAIIMTDTVARRRSVETVFLRISQNSQEKHLCRSLFFIKVASLGSSASLRTRIWLRYFSVNFYRTFPLAAFVMISNARVYNLSSGPYITIFRQLLLRNGTFSSKSLSWANTACRHQTTTTKSLHKIFKQL